jgi:hypothetical protein
LEWDKNTPYLCTVKRQQRAKIQQINDKNEFSSTRQTEKLNQKQITTLLILKKLSQL